MANILCFDTATKACTVGVSINGQCAALVQSVDEGYSHSENLNIYISSAMEKAGLKMTELDAIAVGRGPGSYTGLRIGVSSAKGFAYALDIPIIAIDTLKNLAAQCKHLVNENDYLAPMLDARRMEVYTAFYDRRLKKVREVNAAIIDDDSFTMEMDERLVHFFGNGMEKCRGVLGKHVNARFIPDIEPSAGAMSGLAEMNYRAEQFEDTAYFEPFYLKEFIATVPKKML